MWGFNISLVHLQNWEKQLLASECWSVHPSVHMEQLSFHYINFHEIWYQRIYRKFATKIEFSLKSDKNNGYFTWISMYIYDIELNSCTMRNVSDKVVEKSKTHILCSTTFFFSENCAIYETMWNILYRYTL